MIHYRKDYTHDMQTIDQLARWLDTRFTLPGTSFQFGLDGIIGLIPGVGDTISAGLSSFCIYKAHQYGAPFSLKMKMVWNVIIDWFIGLIPFVGDIFDFVHKANYKNAMLLKDYLYGLTDDVVTAQSTHTA